jgi:hypothetical protein
MPSWLHIKQVSKVPLRLQGLKLQSKTISSGNVYFWWTPKFWTGPIRPFSGRIYLLKVWVWRKSLLRRAHAPQLVVFRFLKSAGAKLCHDIIVTKCALLGFIQVKFTAWMGSYTPPFFCTEIIYYCYFLVLWHNWMSYSHLTSWLVVELNDWTLWQLKFLLTSLVAASA